MASALAGATAVYGRLSLAERTVTQVQLFRTRETDVDRKIVDTLGFMPASSVGSVTGEATKALTIGPGRWLLISENDSNLVARLEAGGLRVVDISHSRTVIRVSGDEVEGLLAKGCSLDFDHRAFPAGHCAGSLLSHFACLFHRTADDSFDLYIARSFAVSAWEWLCESAQSH